MKQLFLRVALNYQIYVRICDTAGQEAYDHVRPLNYHDNVDVVFIAFSIVNRQSFNNVKKRWHEEQQKYMKSAKVMLLIDY